MLKLGKSYSESDLIQLASRRAAKVGYDAATALRGFFNDSHYLGHWWATSAVEMTADRLAGRPEAEAAAEVAAEDFARIAVSYDGRAAYEAWCAEIEAHYIARGGDWFGIRAPAWGAPLVHSTGSGRTLLWWEESGFRGCLVCRPALPGWEGPDFDPPGFRAWTGTTRGSTPVFSRLFEAGGAVSTARETIRLRPGRPGFFATLTRVIRVDSSHAPAPGPWAVLEVGEVGERGAAPGSVAELRHIWEPGLDEREPGAGSKVLAAARAAIDAAFGLQDWAEPAPEPAPEPEAEPEAVALRGGR